MIKQSLNEHRQVLFSINVKKVTDRLSEGKVDQRDPISKSAAGLAV